MIDYDGRRFSPVSDSPGESSRVAVYRQSKDLLWGSFSGGDARRGTLTGVCDPDGRLRFAYCLVLGTGDVVSGRCTSVPTVLDDGRVRLTESWERYGPHAARGTSVLEEIKDEGDPA
jgi:hypothetical protein